MQPDLTAHIVLTIFSTTNPMQISKKADYALRAIVILASLPPGQTIQAQDLARRGDIPIKFLEQIMLVLKRSGFVQSKRGVGGGSKMGKESRLISVGEVIEAIDGELCQMTIHTGEFPDFPGAAGLAHRLNEAALTFNQTLLDTKIEDLLRYNEGDAMAGFGI